MDAYSLGCSACTSGLFVALVSPQKLQRRRRVNLSGLQASVAKTLCMRTK